MILYVQRFSQTLSTGGSIGAQIAYTGSINGTNKNFTPLRIPNQIFMGGVYQYLGTDYNIVGAQVQFVVAPSATDDAGNPTMIVMF